jgi:hypothetical protein
VKLPLAFTIITLVTAINFDFAGHDMANLFDLCLPVISAIDNDHLFDAQVGQNHLPFDHFRLPADNLTGIEHRGIRAGSRGFFVSFGFYRLRVNFREIHQRMRQTILESDAEKLLRPYIDPVSFHINIRQAPLLFQACLHSEPSAQQIPRPIFCLIASS